MFCSGIRLPNGNGRVDVLVDVLLVETDGGLGSGSYTVHEMVVVTGRDPTRVGNPFTGQEQCEIAGLAGRMDLALLKKREKPNTGEVSDGLLESGLRNWGPLLVKSPLECCRALWGRQSGWCCVASFAWRVAPAHPEQKECQMPCFRCGVCPVCCGLCIL